MGQYHLVANLDKREFINPHGFGDGLKLMEQALSGPGGTATGLLLLLSCSNGRGGGDFHPDGHEEVIGRWAGDRIALVGDYAELDDLDEEHDADLIYEACGSTRRELKERAKELEQSAQEYERNGLEWGPKLAAELRTQAERMPNMKPYKDITTKVRKAQAAEGYIKYKKSDYGLMTREVF